MRHLLLTAATVAFGVSAAVAQPTAPTAPAATAPSAADPAAPAAGSASPVVGATIYDGQGAVVGKIEAIDAQNATLITTKSRVRLPLASFGTSPKGPTLGMTAAEVDTAAGPQGAIGNSAPQTAAAASGAATVAAGPVRLTKGATVNDPAGAKAGTIEEVSGDFAVVATGKNKVRLPLNAFADGGTGPVIGMTAAELDAAADAAKPKSGG